MYYAKSPEKSYLHDYVDESGLRMLERAKYHIGRDISSHIFKHSVVRDVIVMRKTGSLETRAVDWQFLLSFIFDVGLTTNGPPNLHIINWRAWWGKTISYINTTLTCYFKEVKEIQVTLQDAQVEWLYHFFLHLLRRIYQPGAYLKLCKWKDCSCTSSFPMPPAVASYSGIAIS